MNLSLRTGAGKRVTAFALLLLTAAAVGVGPAGTSALLGNSPALAAEYQEPIESSGVIDAVSYNDMVIVISDSAFKLSSLVRFFADSRCRDTASRTNFKVGTQVGYYTNNAGEVELLWLE